MGKKTSKINPSLTFPELSSELIMTELTLSPDGGQLLYLTWLTCQSLINPSVSHPLPWFAPQYPFRVLKGLKEQLNTYRRQTTTLWRSHWTPESYQQSPRGIHIPMPEGRRMWRDVMRYEEAIFALQIQLKLWNLQFIDPKPHISRNQLFH